MIPPHLTRQIRRLHLWARRAVEDWLGGAYPSVFKGVGIAFEEVREYQIGDDVRSIDWNVTARMGTPFIKRYVEERELTVMLVVDVSPSMDFGSGTLTKRDVAAEMAALLSLCALKNNDKVGLVTFDHQIRKRIGPRKGNRHAMRLLREVLMPRASAERGDSVLATALDTLQRLLHRRAVVIVISDFLATGFEKPFQRLAAKHDLIAICPRDPWEAALPNVGLLRIGDPETGQIRLVDTANGAFRLAYAASMTRRLESLRTLARSARADWIDVATGGDHLDVLRRFFQTRERRLKKR